MQRTDGPKYILRNRISRHIWMAPHENKNSAFSRQKERSDKIQPITLLILAAEREKCPDPDRSETQGAAIYEEILRMSGCRTDYKSDLQAHHGPISSYSWSKSGYRIRMVNS